MTGPQVLYLVILAVYMLLFALFLRLFIWKRYAEKHHWRRRPDLDTLSLDRLAAAGGRELPRFSLLVPARNEADVIGRTIDHLAGLRYPPDRLEIIIATDEKERLAAASRRQGLVTRALHTLLGRAPWPARSPAEDVLLALLAGLALEEGRAILRRPGAAPALAEALAQPPPRARAVLYETLRILWQGQGARRRPPAPAALLRALPAGAQPEQRERLHAAFLSLAIPAAAAAARLAGEADSRRLHRAIALAARAGQPLTQKVLAALATGMSGRILKRLERLRRDGALPGLLAAACARSSPTTQDIVEAKVAEFFGRPDMPRLKHVEVPADFDGRLGGTRTGREVPSTKGRALNWAFAFADPRSELHGFYDAESRPDPRVLRYAAWRRLTGGPGVRLLQGPVFQVRNFYCMGPLCKIVALYQAVSHDWYLPVLMRTLPFVGGTHLYVDPRLLEQIGGFDAFCLTEDLELGVRAHLEAGAWPEYLPLPSTEQTPATFPAFFRQRLRWGTGYLQVYGKLKATGAYPPGPRRRLLRELLLKGQVQWTLYQLACFLPPVVFYLWHAGVVDPGILPLWIRLALNCISAVYLGFTFYTLARYSSYMDAATGPLARLTGVAQLLALPVSALFLPVPYSSALVLKAFGWQPRRWVKTPRTRE